MPIYGWKDNREFNNNLFAEISVDDKDIVVRGKIVSYSISSSQNWESALEGAGADSKFSMTSAILQTGMAEALLSEDTPKYAGKTLVSIESSIQVWRGAEPLQISLTLEFIAFKNAFLEVELPIQHLHKMSSPLLKQGSVIQTIGWAKSLFKEPKTEDINLMGDVPKSVSVDFLSKRFNSLYQIESVNEDADSMMIDKDGNRIRQTVSINFKSKRAILSDKNDIILTKQG